MPFRMRERAAHSNTTNITVHSTAIQSHNGFAFFRLSIMLSSDHCLLWDITAQMVRPASSAENSDQNSFFFPLINKFPECDRYRKNLS